MRFELYYKAWSNELKLQEVSEINWEGGTLNKKMTWTFHPYKIFA